MKMNAELMHQLVIKGRCERALYQAFSPRPRGKTDGRLMALATVEQGLDKLGNKCHRKKRRGSEKWG